MAVEFLPTAENGYSEFVVLIADFFVVNTKQQCVRSPTVLEPTMSFNKIAVTQEATTFRISGTLTRCSLIALFTLLVGTMAQAQFMVPSPSFPTIPSAISAASPGDTILVAPGTYIGPTIIIDKDIILQSTDGPEVTTLNRTVRFEFNSPNTPGAQVIGFCITGGSGVVCVSNQGTIKNCFITGNLYTGPNGGCGVNLFHSGAFQIINCFICDNGYTSILPTVTGVVNYFSNIHISNSTIVNNHGSMAEGFFGIGSINGNITWVTNSILRTDPDLSQVGSMNLVIDDTNVNGAGVLLGSGNIDADPLFVGGNGGDYHLRADSPCIDAVYPLSVVFPATDFEGDPRPLGLAVDMGADESRVASIGNGQANSTNARLEVNGLSTGSVIGPFSSPVNRGEYFTLDFSGAPNSLYELYASTILNPGGWDFGSFGFFDLGTGPSFADVFVLAPGFSATFPFYSIDAAGQSQLSFYVHPSVAVGPTISIQAIIQNPLPWTNGEFATLSAAHVLVVQ